MARVIKDGDNIVARIEGEEVVFFRPDADLNPLMEYALSGLKPVTDGDITWFVPTPPSLFDKLLWLKAQGFIIEVDEDTDEYGKSIADLDGVDIKFKYIRREGGPGNYKYFYADKEGNVVQGPAPGEEGGGGRKQQIAKTIKALWAIVPPEKKAEIEKYNEDFKAGRDTFGFHFDGDKPSKERELLHKKILGAPEYDVNNKKFKPEKGEKPEFVLFAGPPGSGKTSTLAGGMDLSKYAAINADDFKTKIPEYTGINAAITHKESAYLRDQALNDHIEAGNNILLDGTMHDAEDSIKLIRKLKDRGYKVTVKAVFVESEELAKRIFSRFKLTGRYAPIGESLKKVGKIKKTLHEVRRHVDNLEVYDNTNDASMGGTAQRTETVERENKRGE